MRLQAIALTLAVSLVGTVTSSTTSASAHIERPSVSANPSMPLLKVRTVTYPGDGVMIQRASGQMKRLNKTSKSFQRFVAKRLDQMWKVEGRLPECATAPAVTVKRWRSDGYASASENGNVIGESVCLGGGAQFIYMVQDHQ